MSKEILRRMENEMETFGWRFSAYTCSANYGRTRMTQFNLKIVSTAQFLKTTNKKVVVQDFRR